MFAKDSANTPYTKVRQLAQQKHSQKRNHLFQRPPHRLSFSSAMRKTLSKFLTVRQQLLCGRGPSERE